MLKRLQQQLHDINRSDAGYDIHDFLVTDARIARAISGGDVLTHSGEAMLLSEDEDGVALSLYLDESLLERLKADDPAAALSSSLLDNLCKVIEGLSHFNYVAWRAIRDRSVTLLELELLGLEVEDVAARDVRGHEVRGELDAAAVEAQGLGHGLDQQGLAQAGVALDEDVSPHEHGPQQVGDQFRLAHEDLVHLLLDGVEFGPGHLEGLWARGRGGVGHAILLRLDRGS